MLQAALAAFATVFVAELGDKSQLLALTLASRYRTRVVVAAVLTASALTIGASVLVGTAIGQLLPARALSIGAGLLFLVFAALTWRRDVDEVEDAAPTDERQASSGYLAAVAAIAMAELGDKTMVTTLALAAATSALGVWIGATLGMAAAGAIGVAIGSAVWRRLEPVTVRIASASLFAVVGLVLLVAPLLR